MDGGGLAMHHWAGNFSSPFEVFIAVVAMRSNTENWPTREILRLIIPSTDFFYFSQSSVLVRNNLLLVDQLSFRVPHTLSTVLVFSGFFATIFEFDLNTTNMFYLRAHLNISVHKKITKACRIAEQKLEKTNIVH